MLGLDLQSLRDAINRVLLYRRAGKVKSARGLLTCSAA